MTPDAVVRNRATSTPFAAIPGVLAAGSQNWLPVTVPPVGVTDAAETIPVAVIAAAPSVPVAVGDAANITEPVPVTAVMDVPLIAKALPEPAVS